MLAFMTLVNVLMNYLSKLINMWEASSDRQSICGKSPVVTQKYKAIQPTKRVRS